MLEHTMALLPKFDAAADNPWCIFFKELDLAAPRSKFILTTRNSDRWYKSMCNHFGKSPSLTYEWIYGEPSPVGNKDIYIDRLLRHEVDVRSYFRDRPDDFIEFDIYAGDGWDKLCQFIGKPVPKQPFPRLNTKEMRKA